MKTQHSTLAGLALGLVLLAGCSAEAATPIPAQPAASQAAAPSSAATAPAAANPTVGVAPAAAAMVCSDEAKDSVTKILGLAASPATTPSWDGTTYSCSYKLADGPFTMSVKVATGDAAATAAAKTLAGSLNAAPIKGLSNLGLPGYQSADGSVVFAKDNMTLHVDATTMTPTVGKNKVSRADFAYQMATTILACWSEH
ncbi:hypothetical protein AL755_10015 [Arthrobacter sp. ERGS1:01]|uniref:hypothetical protein n=1 Tax=Arthrobacter sp. ERGS1:01 TaxID=1704044 RepID=UPI0006B4D338|nr:hypothetical protein [Arthrobacter sp. ERGS1:01]ALE05724.1 hypothetical protein AL755_10015 [Arthrobacter sp. ERGS1:01]